MVSAESVRPIHIRALLVNHLDAVVLTFVIGALCLLLHDALNGQTFFLLIGMALVAWLAFAYNDLCDAPYDAQDPKKRYRNFFTRQGSLRYWYVAAPLALSVALLSFLQFSERGLLLIGIALVALWAYSAPPLRLKSRPLFDLITHALFVQTFPYFICLFLIGTTWQPIDYLLLTLFFLSSLSAQLEQQARDYKVDRRTDRNFTTQTGLRTTVYLLRLSTALLVALSVCGALFGIIPPILYPLGLVAVPLIWHRFMRRGSQPRSERLVWTMGILAAVYVGSVCAYYWLIVNF
ncbi:MAG: UbiA family prenyltransferase [Aggregatilineales bacterium]